MSVDDRRPPDRVEWSLLAGTLSLIAAWAWAHHFIIDDAYISFRYAKMAAEGHGLVYNLGVWVEGYTNFLWTILLIPCFWLGADPAIWAMGLGVSSFALVLTAFTVFARRLDASWSEVSLWWLALGTGTMTTYITTGMETMLQAGLVAWLHVVAARRLDAADPWRTRDLSMISTLAALALMTRLDSAIFLVAPALVLIEAWARHRGHTWRDAMAFLAPVGILVGSWFAWKLARYGDVLPNTFYAKTEDGRDLGRGLFYVLYFLSNTFWVAPLLACLAAAIRSRAERVPVMFTLSSVFWCAYVTWTGGGFMEFRFMVPLVPLLAMSALVALERFDVDRRAAMALASMLALASIVHQLTYEDTRSIMRLPGPLHERPRKVVASWVQVGEHLGEAFSKVDGVHIATTAAGALPFTAELRTLDMHGLNEPWVARHGDPYIPVPGHTRIAPLSYVIEQGVHLNLQFPKLYAPEELEGDKLCATALERFHGFAEHDSPIDVVAIAMQPDALYLAMLTTPEPRVDAIVHTAGWRRVRVDPTEGCSISPPET